MDSPNVDALFSLLSRANSADDEDRTVRLKIGSACNELLLLMDLSKRAPTSTTTTTTFLRKRRAQLARPCLVLEAIRNKRRTPFSASASRDDSGALQNLSSFLCQLCKKAPCFVFFTATVIRFSLEPGSSFPQFAYSLLWWARRTEVRATGGASK